jgi:two-component system cell cycle sensor histidine kinase/response regulator CckA
MKLETEIVVRPYGNATNPIGKILIVDDEIELNNALVQLLTAQNYEVTGVNSGIEALACLQHETYDILLSDLMMPEMDGLDLIQAASQLDPNLICIVMTGQGTIQTAVEAMKFGAFDYVLKPFRLNTITPVLTRAMNTRYLCQENLQLREAVAIHELNQTIAFTLNPQTVLSKLADAALQQTDADEVTVLLPTPDCRQLYVAAVRGPKAQHLLGDRIPFDRSMTTWLTNESRDERFMVQQRRTEFSTSVAVPMQVANKLVGVLNLNVIDRSRVFTLGQMKALSILAGTAAVALESASLHAQVLTAEENYRSIFENAVEGMFQATASGRFLVVNPALTLILGHDSPEEVTSSIKNMQQQLFVCEEAWPTMRHALETRGEVVGFEAEVYKKNGQTIWVVINARVAQHDNIEELCCEGSLQDITAVKTAESENTRLLAEVERQRLHLQNIIANVPGLVWEAWGQPDENRVANDFVSDYLQTLLGYTSEEWLSTPGFWLTIVHPDDREAAALEAAATFANGGVARSEFRWVGRHGQIVWVEANYTAIKDSSGQSVGLRGVTTNITDRKLAEEALAKSEEQLRQSQKMEAIGQLAGGVAHDFNNLLTAINGYSELALRRLQPEDPLTRNIEEVRKAGNRAASLTRQLLAFSRKQVLEPCVLNLNAVISDLEKMLRRIIGENIQLRTVLAGDLKHVKADPGQIEQVLLNLAVNARDAMPDCGKLIIETANIDLDEEFARSHVGVKAGPHVALSVSDTGIGMTQEVQTHIFEPFFTTKGIGKGTGLGLSMVYGIVQQSNGTIWVHSDEGSGTTFTIYLPQVQKDASRAHESEAASDENVNGVETVLIVEDEDIVRNLASQVLRMHGYRVLEAANGSSALTICENSQEPIQLLLSDVIMPEMGGVELSNRLSLLRPDVKVLLMSGYTENAILNGVAVDKAPNFIQKPFAYDDLARKVRDVLDS